MSLQPQLFAVAEEEQEETYSYEPVAPVGKPAPRPRAPKDEGEPLPAVPRQTGSIELRDYQNESIKRTIWELHRNNPNKVNSTLNVLATGTGKTLTFAGLIHRIQQHSPNYGTVVLAHRDELIRQAVRHIGRVGIPARVEKAEEIGYGSLGVDTSVVVASVQTLSQPKRLKLWSPKDVRLIITDEAHHSAAATYNRIYKHFDKAVHVGYTATADRLDGENIGKVFQSLAYEYNLRQAIEEGWLVPIKVVQLETDINLKEVRITAGDLNTGDLERVINENVEPLANLIKSELGDLRAICFTPDTTSAEHLAAALSDIGVSARHISYKFDKHTRASTLRDHRTGKFQVLVNASLLGEGYDDPGLMAVIVARPTQSRGFYSQMVGRVTRIDPDNPAKTEGLVIDFSYNTGKHKLVSPVELFDNSDLDSEVLEMAELILKESTEPKDVKDALEEAQERVNKEIERRFRIRERDVKKMGYKRVVLDPIGVSGLLGIPKRREAPWKAALTASPRQISALEKFGVEINYRDPPTMAAASSMIDGLKKRAEQNKARPKQVELVVRMGVPLEEAREMTFQQASDYISKNKTW